MRKNYYYLLFIFIIASCDNKEELPSKDQSTNYPQQLYIINGDIEYWSDITDGSKPKDPIFVYDIPKEADKIDTIQKSTSKTSEQSVSLNFAYGIYDPTNSGCTIKKYNGNKEYYTDAGVYGPNPYPQANGYLVRGYGRAHQNQYYGSLVLFVGNKEEKRTDSRGGVRIENEKNGSAISIEYPFKANVTYEINIKATFYDNRYLLEKKFSDGFPTVYAQLKDNGIITLPNIRNQNQDPCERKDLNDLDGYAKDYLNYTRSYTLDSRGQVQKNINFKFSPIKEKNALLISLHPKIGTINSELPAANNNYTMTLPLITITEKTFDPSINVYIPESTGGGRR
ncbi:hypothetical protein Q1W71_24630 [Flavobacterium pectinovorum]|uniref:hypothetical protein n=1 Tax=Flavobacterium pectinovorum TaxID=29533 RepID=UPI00265F61AA|nr:hypothetical protein [Flavobacterium pectinovorum]WKL48124.1 hypothetical protein Q1W71_24630 [Flavobacterium pectinovorum]